MCSGKRGQSPFILTGLELCTGLTELFIAYNPITDFYPLADLTNLTSLSIIGCGMDDVHPLENLVNLEYLALMDNEITTLGGEPFCGSWGIMANAGIGAGDTVYVDGNPLTVWAICGEIRELRDRGVYVSPDIVCDDDPQSTGDWDGDTFTNAEELRFIQYFYNDPEIIDAFFRWYIMFDNLPGVTRDCYENLDTVAVIVEVHGEGSVYLGNGYVTEGNPKTWECAQHGELCSTLCTAPDECGASSIQLVAEPSPEWTFRRWYGANIDESYEPLLSVTMDDAYGIHAEFINRPGLDSLDLVAALQYLLTQWGIGTSLQEFDVNGIAPDEDANPISAPNGIPDAAEFYLLQSILQDIYFNLASTGGASHDATWLTWENNLQRAQDDLPELAPAIQRVIAAYMTLGNDGSVMWAENEIQARYSITISGDNYDLTTQEFTADEDADNDGLLNQEEWDYVSGLSWGDALEDFTSYSLDGERSVPPGSPSGGGDGECDQECIDYSTVSISAFPAEGGEVSTAPDPGSHRRGKNIEARAVPSSALGYDFYNWSADETMIDGGKDKTDTFPMMENSAPRANFYRTFTEIPDDTASFAISWSGNGYLGTGPAGKRAIYHKPSESITLSASVPPGAPEGTEVYAWSVLGSSTSADNKFKWSSSITVRSDANYAKPLTRTQKPNPMPKKYGASASPEPADGGRVDVSGVAGTGFARGVYPGGISVVETFLASFTARANDGYVFDEWVWDGGGSSSEQTVNFYAQSIPSSLKAKFVKSAPSELKITVVGCGWVESETKRKYFTEGQYVTLTAHPAVCQCAGCCSGFKGWTSTAEGHIPLSFIDEPLKNIKTPAVHVKIKGKTTVTATFSEAAKAGSNEEYEEITFPGVGCAGPPESDPVRSDRYDDCDNRSRVICWGQWETCFKSMSYSYCEYLPAGNLWRFYKSGTNAKQFTKIVHVNEDGQSMNTWKTAVYDRVACNLTTTYRTNPTLPQNYDQAFTMGTIVGYGATTPRPCDGCTYGD